jgi:hypothetical protein
VRILKQLTPAQKWTILLSTMTFLLGLGNLGSAAVAIQQSVRLPGLSTSVSFRYLAAVGALWGVLYLVCTFGLSFFQPWGRWMTLAAVPLHQVHVWTNRLLFDASDYARQIYPRDLMLTLLLLLIIWGVLNLPAMKEAFSNRQGADQLR